MNVTMIFNSREIESKQEVELKKREAEIELRSVKSSNEKVSLLL